MACTDDYPYSTRALDLEIERLQDEVSDLREELVKVRSILNKARFMLGSAYMEIEDLRSQLAEVGADC